MRVLFWAAVVVAFAGAAAAQEAQMAAEGEDRELIEDEARELSPCSGGRRLGEPDEVTDGRELQVVACSKIKCKTKCGKATGCAWTGMPKKCRSSLG
jgi:hypothetical protein